MFEKYTLENQQADRVARGWDLKKFGALPDPTAEVVIYRKPKELSTGYLNHEILVAYRVRGIPDCRNRWQGKWGTQVRAGQDRTSFHAIQRAINEFFSWEVEPNQLKFAATMGPWIHRATVTHGTTECTMFVQDEPGEATPWKGDVFCFNATGLELPEQGGYMIMARTQWLTIKNLIRLHGQDPSFMYWSVIAACIPTIFGYKAPRRNPTPYFGPGNYRLWPGT